MEPEDDVHALLVPRSQWTELAEAQDRARRSLLAEPQPMRDWGALQPREFGNARFDEQHQALVWPLVDDDGQVMLEVVRYQTLTHSTIERIERLDQAHLPDGTLLIGRVQRGPAGITVEPLSLVRPASRDAVATVDVLAFSGTSASSTPGATTRTDRTTQPVVAADRTPAALRELRLWTARQAERGVAPERDDELKSELRQRVDSAAAVGLVAFGASAGDTASPFAATLLRVRYLCLQHERLLGTDGEGD